MGRGRTGGRRPHDEGPRLYQRGRYWGADLRPWGGERTTLRDPTHPRWPHAGDRTEDRQVARRWAEAYVDLYEDDRRRRHLGRPARAPRLGHAIDEYRRHRKQHVEESTYESEGSVFNWIRNAFGETVPIDEITTKSLQRLIDRDLAQGYAPGTMRRFKTTLGTFFRHSGIKDPPTTKLAIPKTDEKRVRYWTDDEMVRLRSVADDLDRLADADARRRSVPVRLVVELAVATGARQRELFALRWTDFRRADHSVEIERQQKRYVAAETKGPKGDEPRRALVLPEWWSHHRPDSIGHILTNRFDQPCNHNTQDRIIEALLERAGLGGLGVAWHGFRHTYARLFLERGGGLHELQRCLGHESLRTTEFYYGHLEEDVVLRRAGEAIYGT